VKISEQEVSRLLSYSLSERTGSAAQTFANDTAVVRTSSASQVDISDTAQEIRRVTNLIKQLPDVREDRVQALKAQIENGTYHVSSEDIADLIIRRALADNTAN